MSDEKDKIYERPIKNHGGSKYLRKIYPADGVGEPILVDIYCVIEAFQVSCPGRQQAIKKILCAGLRNKGSQVQDLKEVFDAMWRALELQKQREVVPIVNLPNDSILEAKNSIGEVVNRICKICGGDLEDGKHITGCPVARNY